ncbi:MAG TPA: dihydropteroate synthase [Rhizomicrobium sp.]|nr:dihydropteroate synthase [Rhizomicrobium sp.]
MTPQLFGILNITEDSFSDGGRYLAPAAALSHAKHLIDSGANVLDIGAASSNPDAAAVPPDVEIARLAAVVPQLQQQGIAVSIDTFSPPVQLWALDRGVAYLNDIQGFADPEIYPALAASSAKLIVMHAVQARGKATEIDVPPDEILPRCIAFFQTRIAALTGAGIARERLILDPGMGFFLGTNPATSLAMLAGLPQLKRAFGLPLFVSVSRKSFLRKLTGRKAQDSGPATLAAELFAARQGADHIRTHDPAAIADALKVWDALDVRHNAG